MTRLELPEHTSVRLRDSGYCVLITGASGWLGQAALELPATALGRPAGAVTLNPQNPELIKTQSSNKDKQTIAA